MPSLNKVEFRNNYYVTDMIPGKDLDLVKMPAGIATINISSKYIHMMYDSPTILLVNNLNTEKIYTFNIMRKLILKLVGKNTR